MKCPECHFSNRDSANFCTECGYRFEFTCPDCLSSINSGKFYCKKCNRNLTIYLESEIVEISEQVSERKNVTVLFSDLSGYTTLCEKCDAEEVKKITNKVFSAIKEIIIKYDGFIEKYIGDAIMAIFGAIKSSEDDPVRAIRAAIEINENVNVLSPEIEKSFGCKVSMHFGVNTGLVVTGEINCNKGTHGISGDTINVAARLCSIGQSEQILVSKNTYQLTKGYFIYDQLDPKTLKGKSSAVDVYKVLSTIRRPNKVHRISGLRSELIDREIELKKINNATSNLLKRIGSIILISGDAGTGKSRLVKEIKTILDLSKIHWLEGNAYSYTQKIPYSIFIDLLSRYFHLQERDSPQEIKDKISHKIENIIGKNQKETAFITGLFSVENKDLDIVSPEFWKNELYDSLKCFIEVLIQESPTIFCFEDLHWSDPSSIELFRTISLKFFSKAIFLCTFRSNLILFNDTELMNFEKDCIRISTRELSFDNVIKMIKSLLNSEEVPESLLNFIRKKVEGNPFYLEEIMNSLIESGLLYKENNMWVLSDKISQSSIPSTIQGVLSSRIDRLSIKQKTVLRESSVIGRSFLYEILKQATKISENIAKFLDELQNLDLIILRSFDPDIEYIFKHALTQEVVYNTILIDERKNIHLRIGEIIEKLYKDRLQEFYDALAFHYQKAQAKEKAIQYLLLSGEKSLKKYAIEESYNYYNEAYIYATSNYGNTIKEDTLILKILNKWALVFYYKADFKKLLALLKKHKKNTKTIDDKFILGMYYSWLGFSMYVRHNYKDAYKNLLKALEIGEVYNEKEVEGYALTWLTFLYGDIGEFEKSIKCAERATKIGMDLKYDPYIIIKPSGGVAQTSFYMGDVKRAYKAAELCSELGKKQSNTRGVVMGHIGYGLSYAAAGDFESAINEFKCAINVSADPMYKNVGYYALGFTYLQLEDFEKSREALQRVIEEGKKFGLEWSSIPSMMMLGAIYTATDKMSKGFKMILRAKAIFEDTERKPFVALSDLVLGKIYFLIMKPKDPIKISFIIKNFFFLVKTIFFASKKAEYHFNKAISLSKEIGANSILGQAYFELGLLHIAKKRKALGVKFIRDAANIFEQCGSHVFLKKALSVLSSI